MGMWNRLFARKRRYDDLAVSIEEHLAERADELEAEGMPRAEAEQAARREFGNVTLLKERSREVWQWQALESLCADLRHVLRRLGKAPAFTATVLLTLAIGIGANTAVFSVVDGVLLKPLAYPDADRLVALTLNAPGAAGLADFSSGLPLSASMYLTFAEHNRSFEHMGVWAPQRANVTGLAQPEEIRMGMLTDGVLEALAVPPLYGRWLGLQDQDPRGAKTVMLSYGYWQRRFGGDPGVVGRSIIIDAVQRTIVGVMPRKFRLMDQDFDVLMPVGFDPHNEVLAGFGYTGLARLKPGVTIEQANADVQRLVGVWMDSWTNGPGTNPHWYENWRITAAFRPLKQQVVGEVSRVLWVVLATVGLVMLIACTNVANLLLVRAEARQQELAIRAALGAGRARMVRELLLESVVLGLMGGVLSLGVAWGGLRLLARLGPAQLPRLHEIALDARSLAVALGLSLLSGLLFGAIPALHYAGARTRLLLGSARGASAGRSRQRVRKLLAVAQVAMALVLLVSALLMIRTFWKLRTVAAGFSGTEHVQTVRVKVPDDLVTDQRVVTQIQREILDHFSAIPGVESASFAEAIPLEGMEPNWDEMHFEGKRQDEEHPPLRLFNYVAPGYFRALGTRLIAGRDFTWSDVTELQPVTILSENLAREIYGSAQAAVGKHIRQFSSMPWQEVVGVVEDVRFEGMAQDAPTMVYWAAMCANPYVKGTIHAPRAVTFVLRTPRAGSATLMREMEQAVWQVNGNLPLAEVNTLDQMYAKSMARTSFTLVMLGIAGAMALVLGVLGIYGVISYTVAQRTREIGIRLALGSGKGALQWMFVRSALRLAGAGVLIGMVAAAVLLQGMKSLLYAISPLDPLSYAAITLVLVAAAAAASYLPARRAAGVDPVEALRSE